MNIVRVTSVNKVAGQRLSCGRVVVVLSPFRWRVPGSDTKSFGGGRKGYMPPISHSAPQGGSIVVAHPVG